MADTNSNRDVFSTLSAGFHITKATETVPQSSTQNIFTVTGGYCLVKALVGQVTTAIGAGSSPDLKVTAAPTVGTATDVATDVVVASDEIGTLYYVEGDGTALIPIGSGYAQACAGQGFIVTTGVLRIATSESTVGATRWDLWYFPLDEGAAIVSA